jgi:hypothetical protein
VFGDEQRLEAGVFCGPRNVADVTRQVSREERYAEVHLRSPTWALLSVERDDLAYDVTR